MKRVISLLLIVAMVLMGCGQSGTENGTNKDLQISSDLEWTEEIPSYDQLSDPELLSYVEDTIYRETIDSLDSEEYYVENVSAVYISKEYIDEIEYNSQSNIYFGSTIAELDEIFQGSRYVFTLSSDGKTTYKELEEIDDSITGDVLKKVAIGTGVILVCVTVSTVTAGLPAVSMIFAVSAKTGTLMALSSGGMGALSAGITRGIQTGDFEEAMEAALVAGSDGFMWGAISGCIAGGAGETLKYTKAMKALKGVELKGINKQQAAAIQMESGFPMDVVKEFTNMKQYEILKKAGITAKMVNGQTALVRKIDLNYVDDIGRTNLERMKQGLAALDDTGVPYELHHIGQKADSTLAILTKKEHRTGDNHKIWHEFGKETEVHGQGNNWDAQRKKFWEAIAKSMEGKK